MASVRVRVAIDSDAPDRIKKMPEVKEALTAYAGRIASTANSIGAGFKTGYYYRDHKAPPVGGTSPVYSYEKAKDSSRYGSVATVHPKNYAAMKDAVKNNTLLKAGG